MDTSIGLINKLLDLTQVTQKPSSKIDIFNESPLYSVLK